MRTSLYNDEDRKDQRRGLIYAISLHVALFLLLLAGLLHAPSSPGPIQIELWAEGDLQIEEDPTDNIIEEDPDEALDEVEVVEDDQIDETIEPEPEPEPQPEPEVLPGPEVEAETAPTPEQTPEHTDLPLEEDPDIALREAEKEQRAREEAERKAREEAEQKAKEEAERKAREEAEQKAKEEAERKAREEAEQKAKEEAERKAREEAEQKAKEEAERKAREEAEQKAKEEAERKAREEAERKAKIRDAMRADGQQAAGISGGTADRNVAAGGGGDDGYAARVRSCIKPRVVFNTPPRSGSHNPTLQFRVTLDANGIVQNVTISESSGNRAFDDAVQKGITKCSPFPKPTSGQYPKTINGVYRMYD